MQLTGHTLDNDILLSHFTKKKETREPQVLAKKPTALLQGHLLCLSVWFGLITNSMGF